MDDIQLLARQSGLFNTLTSAELDKVVQSADYVELPSNWVIMREGEPGSELFIVVDGGLQVYTHTQDGQEIVLAKHGKGAFVGEQALLHEDQGRRNASVRTTETTTLLRIHKEDFQHALASDSPLRNRLLQRGEEQIKDKLLRQSILFRSLRFDETQEWHDEVAFADQEIIFKQGDPGKYYYLILEGQVSVHQQTGDHHKVLAYLDVGQGLGELALLKRDPRGATAIAQGYVRLLRINGDVFRNLYQNTPELREYFQTLQKIYPLSGHGLVTQHMGKFLDMDCVTMMFHLDDGRTAFSSQVIGQDIFSINVNQEDDQARLEELRYHNAALKIEREVKLYENIPVGITSYGLWEELGEIHNRIVTKTPFAPEDIQHFRQHGQFFPKQRGAVYKRDDIVCGCMQITYGATLDVMQRGYRTVDEIAEVTGCTTVCGSCRPQVREIIGEGGWVPVRVLEEFEIVPNIRSFRFAPYGNAFDLAKPGQHVVIQAHIDGVPIQRPYTISSAANEVNSREITVKRENQGYFSNWLFDKHRPEMVLRLSEPQGEYYVDLQTPEPVIFFVAGIGVTPALSTLRTMLDEESQQSLYIDYSASTSEQIVHRQYLQEIAKANAQIDVNFRVTQENGRISQADVTKVVKKYPNARIYICGPVDYQTAVEDYLKAAAVDEERIHIETFTPIGSMPETTTLWEQLSTSIYLPIGLGLLALFILQDALQLKWPWLEAVQATESLKRWTGLFLSLYILLQWYLPYLRWRGKLKTAAHQYHWHKLQGAFSPLIYYVHSTELGYAYLWVLSSVYFANFVLGLFNQEMIPKTINKTQYAYYWLILHIVLSVSLISLLLYHIYIVFAYK